MISFIQIAETPPSFSGADPGAGATAAQPDSGSLADLLVRFQHSRLSPTQRRIACSVLAGLQEAALMSSIELAARAGVSQPSVTRFAVAVGFSGYHEFREALRRTVLVPSPHLRAAAGLGTEQALPLVARELAGSTPLLVRGLRASAALAQHFGNFAQRICPDVRLAHADGCTVLDAVLQTHAAGGTWLVAFVLPRYPAESVRAVANTIGAAYESNTNCRRCCTRWRTRPPNPPSSPPASGPAPRGFRPPPWPVRNRRRRAG
ncbi:MAG TPA: hypothetical protein VGN54_09730 [Mycobacteriales bacterium]|nr:hypothetical protein [Mycobacteriales bacterium]